MDNDFDQEIDPGAFAALLADAAMDLDSEGHIDSSAVLEGGRGARFTVTMPSGQQFVVEVTEQ